MFNIKLNNKMNNEIYQKYFYNLNILIQTIDKNDSAAFIKLIKNPQYFINKKILEILFFYCSEDNNFKPIFLSILINFGVDPNLILEDPNIYTKKNINLNNQNNFIDSNNNGYRVRKSILMMACKKSNFSLIQNLCDANNANQKSLNVNYFDKNGRNALFYLNGGSDDKKIIELLVEKGIDVNKKDKDENTPLNFLIVNTKNVQLIQDLIEVGKANFMIKNKEGKNGLDLINDTFIQRNNNNIINNFDEIKPLIKLLKNKLSIKLFPSNKFNENDSEKNNSLINNNNLIKFSSSLSTTSTISNSENNENPHNIYLKLNPLSLVVDMQFNDNNINNISSTSKKIDYYTQLNRNKKYLLNLLKNAENHIKENSRLIEEEIMKKKEEVKLLQNNLNEKVIKLNEKKNIFSNDLEHLKNELNKKKFEIIEKKQNLLKEKNKNLFEIKHKTNFLYKYTPLINQDLKIENIYHQLQIDLIDFMAYVHKRNEKLEPTLNKLNDLILQSVKNCLGEDYQLNMYGSRATKLCLPWSDIDYVISCSKNKHFEPLRILNDYLLELNDKFFIDIKYIASASIPVLKIFSNNDYHKISLDISMENVEHHGGECVNYIKQKIKEYEVLTPLTFALKTILQKAFLNDPYKGGLSSYGVILLIIHFLNVQKKKGNDISMKNLGKLFYDILYYYGSEYDITNPIIIEENEKLEQKIIAIHQFQVMKSEFVLVDPLNISNNVARNTRQYQNIKLAFKLGFVSIKESCECGCHYQYDGLNIKEEECEHNLLNRIFNDVKRDGI